ncbi:MAG: hypothetical protein HQ546_00605 [Planctomycetes bacterium]|nr:hypothetical protein [Planctomycetota bacterium]
MKTKKVLTVAIGLASILVSLSLLAADAPASAPDGPASMPASTGNEAPAGSEAAADAVIQALLRSRVVKEPVLPTSATAPAGEGDSEAPKALFQPLPKPPGSMIFNRLGRLVKDEASGWWTFRFESEKNLLYEPPMRVLPNRLLEEMETILEKNSIAPTVRFLVSGEVTHYRGNQYLLIRRKLVKREMGSL